MIIVECSCSGNSGMVSMLERRDEGGVDENIVGDRDDLEPRRGGD